MIKNKDKKKYKQEYYLKNKEKCLQLMKNWYCKNVEKRKKYNKQKYLENHQERIIAQKKYYLENKGKILNNKKNHRKEMRIIIDSIAIAYGCQNINCKWTGPLLPAMLEFHHYKPKEKLFQLGKAADFSKKKVSEEVNKCVVLCSCCHKLFHIGLIQLNENMLCTVDENLSILLLKDKSYESN